MTVHTLAETPLPAPTDITIPPELQARDWIFADPASYRAGVREALAWLASSPDHARAAAMQSALRSAQPMARTTPPADPMERATGS
jgi:hypothetical protein